MASPAAYIYICIGVWEKKEGKKKGKTEYLRLVVARSLYICIGGGEKEKKTEYLRLGVARSVASGVGVGVGAIVGGEV